MSARRPGCGGLCRAGTRARERHRPPASEEDGSGGLGIPRKDNGVGVGRPCLAAEDRQGWSPSWSPPLGEKRGQPGYSARGPMLLRKLAAAPVQRLKTTSPPPFQIAARSPLASGTCPEARFIIIVGAELGFGKTDLEGGKRK